MTGYTDGYMAVEVHKGEWILRAPLAGDQPVTDSDDACDALTLWKHRNAEKFRQSTAAQ